MEIIDLFIDGPKVIKPKVFGDKRGHFFESYRKDEFEEHGLPTEFVQDNQSMSHKGILRGLHFQSPPHAQGKLVRVISGKVLDVIVDIRLSSPTYGKWHSEELSAENNLMLWVPEGFAHGFYTLEDNTIFTYKCTNYYNVKAEDGIPWDDKSLNIGWEVEKPILSAKDITYKSFKEFKSPFS